MKKLLSIILVSVMLAGCTPVVQGDTAVSALPDITAAPSPVPPQPIPEPTPEPTPRICRASVGAVGDILMMTSQISFGKTGDSYDFSRSYSEIAPLFRSVDIMAANFECTLAGEEAGYTQPRPEAADEFSERPFQTFNAPDELAANLRDAGIDLLTTANNHSVDRDMEGVFRTIEVIRSAGLMQTGTFLSESDRDMPCMAEVNGIRLGFAACTESVNRRDKYLGDNKWAVARLKDQERIAREIALCKEQGADFVIVFPHWGDEYENQPNRGQMEQAQWLADAGADAILGSHPHVVQPFGWVKASDGRQVFVAWSLGNFISNMSRPYSNFGMFVRLDIEKSPDGGVSCTPSYIPTACIKQSADNGRLHQAVPCWQDEARRGAYLPMDDGEFDDTRDAYGHVYGICGEDKAKLIEWSEEYD